MTLEEKLQATPETKRRMEYLVTDLANRQGKHNNHFNIFTSNSVGQNRINNGNTSGSEKYSNSISGNKKITTSSGSPDSSRRRQQLSLRPVRKVMTKEYTLISSSSDEDFSICSKKSLHSRPTPPPRGKNGPTYANLPKTPQMTRKSQSPSDAAAATASSSSCVTSSSHIGSNTKTTSSSSRAHTHLTPSAANRSGSLDRKLADMQRFNFSEYRLHKKQLLAATADKIRDQRAANSSNHQITVKHVDQIDNNQNDCTNYSTGIESHPPTPPMHRCPSWELRIYQVASSSTSNVMSDKKYDPKLNGNNKVSSSQQLDNNKIKSNPVAVTTNSSSSCSTYDQSSIFSPHVPMYSTVGGKASLIKSLANVSLDSSDSDSDSDADVAIKTNNRSSFRTTDDASSLSTSSAAAAPVSDKIHRSDSENYDVPPDAVITVGTPFHCPQTPLRYASLRKELRNMMQSKINIEKSGYLKKLGGKFKTWRKRWFVLKDSSLSYYKNESDYIRGKIRDTIKIDGKTAIARGANNIHVFQISHPSDEGKKNFLLNSPDIATVESWISVLKEVIYKCQRKSTFGGESVPSIEGWLTRVKHGHSKKIWSSLMNDNLFFFKGPDETVPFGSINIKQTTVKEVTLSDTDSDGDVDTHSSSNNTSENKFTISIEKDDDSPVYFLCDTREQFDSWMYYLSISNSNASQKNGSNFERLTSQILALSEDINGQSVNNLWNETIMCATRDIIDEPLTTLPSQELKRDALALFKSIHLFTTVPIDSAGIDYHIALAQNSLELCMKKHHLQNEFICQLIKQTNLPKITCPVSSTSSSAPPSIPPHQSKGPSKSSFLCGQPFSSCEPFISPCEEIILPSCSFTTQQQQQSTHNHPVNLSANGATSPSSSSVTPITPLTLSSPSSATAASTSSPSTTSSTSSVNLVQGLQLLALSLPLFLPKSQTLWLLKVHLKRLSNKSSESGQLALYCCSAIDKTSQVGNRIYRPSRMEVLGILLRNPYQHSHSHSIPVHLTNDTYVVIGFNASTSVNEFFNFTLRTIDIRSADESGFALFSDDPINDDIEHVLKLDMKLADVIARWEMDFRDGRYGKIETSKIIKLSMKKRLFLSKNVKYASDKEKLLLVYQLHQDILNGKFNFNTSFIIELTALIAQIEFNSLSHQDELIKQVIKKFIPPNLCKHFAINILIEQIRDRWKLLSQRSQIDCIRVYLNAIRKCQYWDCHLYSAIVMKNIIKDDTSICFTSTNAGTNVFLALNETHFCILDGEKNSTISSIPLVHLVTFGGDGNESFVLIARKILSPIYSDPADSNATTSSSNTSDVRTTHEKFVFSLDKWSSLELSQLMADYINIANANNFTSANLHCPSPRKVSKFVTRSNTRI